MGAEKDSGELKVFSANDTSLPVVLWCSLFRLVWLSQEETNVLLSVSSLSSILSPSSTSIQRGHLWTHMTQLFSLISFSLPRVHGERDKLPILFLFSRDSLSRIFLPRENYRSQTLFSAHEPYSDLSLLKKSGKSACCLKAEWPLCSNKGPVAFFFMAQFKMRHHWRG